MAAKDHTPPGLEQDGEETDPENPAAHVGPPLQEPAEEGVAVPEAQETPVGRVHTAGAGD